MMGEHAIRIEELASLCIGTQRFKDLCRKESAAAITGIDDDMHMLQRFCVVITA